MKNRKPAARRLLAVTAGCAALALSACGAGQISQTANQVAAVNGTNGELGDAVVRDVTLITQEDNSVALKFNASNQGVEGDDITLERISVQDASVDLGESVTISPDCSVVADSESAIKEMNPSNADVGCTQYLDTTVDGENFYSGAARVVTFEFSNGDIEINAPIVAWYTEAGQTNRHQDGVTREGTDTIDGDHEGPDIG
ncbi:MAG: hypothetical protein ACI38U_14435 [Corynebacterium sp.]|uniref:hypothetical protein n=1 Tax=unclassified Corynebacterium TaxID=2624378 RepID=UPI00095B1914|nr:hypothetical protein [Corynebacterium sp. CNJ-954]OLT50032.1 hypothetical protein BJF89_11435 [Corynebacterium sp. CNJ-954]